jgi:hypothetical protein
MEWHITTRLGFASTSFFQQEGRHHILKPIDGTMYGSLCKSGVKRKWNSREKCRADAPAIESLHRSGVMCAACYEIWKAPDE